MMLTLVNSWLKGNLWLNFISTVRVGQFYLLEKKAKEPIGFVLGSSPGPFAAGSVQICYTGQLGATFSATLTAGIRRVRD
jgi:hypothetical protein